VEKKTPEMAAERQKSASSRERQWRKSRRDKKKKKTKKTIPPSSPSTHISFFFRARTVAGEEHTEANGCATIGGAVFL
jgi:hypothetical protein